MLLPCLESPDVVFLNTLEDILKGGGLICELYTCVCIVITTPSHHTHVNWDSCLSWRPVETLANPSPLVTWFLPLFCAKIICIASDSRWEPSHSFSTPRLFVVSWQWHMQPLAVLVASSFRDARTSSFKKETECVFILSYCAGQVRNFIYVCANIVCYHKLNSPFFLP